MARYGTTREMLSAVAVKNHRNGAKNPFAQYPFEITAEAVAKSVMVADPLRILDCSPITDGAAAVIVTHQGDREEAETAVYQSARLGDRRPTSIALAQREDITTIKSATLATQKALKMAGKKIERYPVCRSA